MNILRTQRLDPLSTETLRRFAPALFATEPDNQVSRRYGFLPTYQVVEKMHAHGFIPVEVRNYQRRDSTRLKYTKHMVRFRQAGKLRAVGDVIPQIIMLNSHDRSSRYEIYSGLYRLVCANGLVVGESSRTLSIRHTANVIDDIIEATERLTQQQKETFKHVDAMRKTHIEEKKQYAFAKHALALRPTRAGSIDPASLLIPRRNEDNGTNLWSVFNRVQENLIKGGVEGRTENGRRTRTTEIKAISADMKINTGIWALAMNELGKGKDNGY